MTMNKDMGLIALESYAKQAKRINQILCKWKNEDNFMIDVQCPRFSSGEAKCILNESVREKNIYIFVDICNNSIKYKMDGEYNRMSPDDHYQDLKRVIAACNGKARKINVIMPFLYEGRQHRRMARESLDCALMLKELQFLGVDNIITFDAHDPRIQNVLPLQGIDNISPALQFTQQFLTEYEDIRIDPDHLMFIAPDEGATERVVFFATLFGVNIGMFYKRRDYANIIDGTNPIIAHDFCGGSLEGMDAVVVDDMISSGGSIIDVCKQIRARGAKRIFIFATFGLFTSGFEKIDKAYEQGLFDRILTTNLVYQKPELLKKEYYLSVNMNRYVAAIIDTMNNQASMQKLIKPEDRIKQMIKKYTKA